MKNKIQRLLLSRTTALTLIAAIAVLCLIGVNIPQLAEVNPAAYHEWRSEYPAIASVVEALDFHRMYSSTVFLAFVTLLTAVMSIAMVKMIVSVRTRTSRTSVQFDDKFFKHFFSFETKSTSVVDITRDKTRARGYIAKELSPDVSIFTKNSAGGWGTVLFHFGLVVIIAASLFSFLFQNRGFIQLLEKDTFFGNQSDFLVQNGGPLAKPFAPDIYISLQKFTPHYYSDGKINSLESRVVVGSQEKAPEPMIIAVNEPFVTDGVKIYQSTAFGHTVGMMLEFDGENIPAYFSLDCPKELGQPFIGVSDYPNSPYIISLQLTPDPQNESFDLVDPILKIEVKENKTIKYSGTMKPGDRISLDRNSLQFVDVRHWSGFILNEDFAIAYVFAGFLFALTGLILVYFFPRREIYMSSEETYAGVLVKFGGISARESALFHEEFELLIESIYFDEGVHYVGSELVAV